MPYVGTGLGFGGFVATIKDSFTGDGSETNFTLSRNATSAFDLEVFVGNVRQEPAVAYTVSGTTLSFTGTPANGETIYVVHQSGALTSQLPSTFLGVRDYTIGGNLNLNVDNSSALKFGADQDVTITHVADSGLTLKNTATTDDKPFLLTLQTGETDIAASDKLGVINFQAPDEGTGTDAILVAAGIEAVSEGDFSSSSNATKLSFKTASSAAAAETMALSSGGNLSLPTDATVVSLGADADVTLTHVHDTGILLNSTNVIQFNDASQNIGAPSATVLDINATDEIELNATLVDVNANLDVSGTYTGAGVMTTGGNVVIPNNANIGSVGDTDSISIDSSGNITASQNLTVSGTLTVNGTTTTVNSTTVTVDDPIFTLGGDSAPGSDDNKDRGIEFRYHNGSAAKVGFFGFDDSTSAFTFIPDATNSSEVFSGTVGNFVVGDISVADDMNMVSDSAQITFGTDGDVTLTHVPDIGLTLKSTATADDKPIILTLQTGETDMAANDVMGAIRFQAPDEGTGTDAILVAAAIQAVSEGDFSASSNATRLEFHTGASEAASSKMTLSSAGLLTIADDFMIKDGGTIGVASTNDAITISSAGIVTFKDDILIKDGGTIGSASDADAITIASNGQLTLTQTLIGTALDISGDIDVDGTTNLDVVDIDGAVNIDSSATLTCGPIVSSISDHTNLSLTSTNADANQGPKIDLIRDSSSPADNDSTGSIIFKANDDAGNSVQYARIATQTLDVSDGTEDGLLTLDVIKDGSNTSGVKIKSDEVSINDGSVDMDFRVETDTKTHMFFVEGSTNRIGVNTSNPGGQLHLTASETGTDQIRISAAIGSYATNGIRIENSLDFSNTYSFIATQTDSDGDATGTTTRHLLRGDGYTAIHADVASAPAIQCRNDGNATNRYGLYIQCGADNSNGTNYAIRIFDGDGTEQGNVTFSGGTVSYNAFTAGHPAILPDDDNDDGYAYGTLVETTNVGYSQKDGSDTERGIVYTVRKTQDANSKRVLGVYSGDLKTPTEYYHKDSPEVLQGLKTVDDVRTPAVTNMHQIYCLGDGHILCNNAGGNISAGDGICSSNTAGIGQKATANPSMIIGIAEEDITFASNSETKLVPVQFGKQQYVPWS